MGARRSRDRSKECLQRDERSVSTRNWDNLSTPLDHQKCGRTNLPRSFRPQVGQFYRSFPDVGDLEEVALQILQVDAEVEPPVGAQAARPADGRGVDRANAVAAGQRRGGVALPKLVGHPAQPLLGSAKPLKQGHRGNITPTGLSGPGGCFLERTTGGQVDQQGSQQDGRIGKASGAAQRTQKPSLLLPARRQELAHQRPVIEFFSNCIGVHPENDTNPTPRQQALS
jgi:hypothetical protein